MTLFDRANELHAEVEILEGLGAMVMVSASVWNQVVGFIGDIEMFLDEQPVLTDDEDFFLDYARRMQLLIKDDPLNLADARDFIKRIELENEILTSAIEKAIPDIRKGAIEYTKYGEDEMWFDHIANCLVGALLECEIVRDKE